MSNGGDLAGVSSPSGRVPRLPRWTRQEILVLIEGKRVVEGRGRGRGRSRGGGRRRGGWRGDGVEPTKWAAVADYCRRHGVERGPVQCRKRWSNLAGDYKKIREWERSASASTSFWAMRNDARRERRLPGFFDREVYDILDGRGGGRGANAGEEAVRMEVEEERKEKEEAVFDSGRAAGEDGLFSSDEEEDDEEETPAPPPPPPAAVAVRYPVSPLFLTIDEKSEAPRQESSEQGTSKGKQPGQNTEDPLTIGGQKRRRSDDGSGEATDLQSQLIEIIDRNSQMMAAQLEVQNINCQLDREQRKDQANSLLGVLSRLADALSRIADKL